MGASYFMLFYFKSDPLTCIAKWRVWNSERSPWPAHVPDEKGSRAVSLWALKTANWFSFSSPGYTKIPLFPAAARGRYKLKGSTSSWGCAAFPTLGFIPRSALPSSWPGSRGSGSAADAEPAGQGLERRPSEKRALAEQVQISLLHSLKASLPQHVSYTLGIFFQTWKTFSPHTLMDQERSSRGMFSSSCPASSWNPSSAKGEAADGTAVPPGGTRAAPGLPAWPSEAALRGEAGLACPLVLSIL